jgi:hypothetical protein
MLKGAQCSVDAIPCTISQDGGGESKHLTQLERLDFLVLDEADRMVQQGHYQVRRRAPCSDAAGFPLAQRGLVHRDVRLANQHRWCLTLVHCASMMQELGNIVEYVVANRGGGGGGKGRKSGEPADASADGGSADSDSEAGDSDIEAGSGSDQDAEEAEEAQASGSSGDDDVAAASPPETDAAPAAAAGSGSGKQDGGATRPLQTFVFSATLTLPAGLRRRLRKGMRTEVKVLCAVFSRTCCETCLQHAASPRQDRAFTHACATVHCLAAKRNCYHARRRRWCRWQRHPGDSHGCSAFWRAAQGTCSKINIHNLLCTDCLHVCPSTEFHAWDPWLCIRNSG